MMHWRYLLVACCWVSAATAADATLDSCVLCHGTNLGGNVGVRAPKLAGLPSWYIERQLTAFRSGVRGTHAQDVSGGEMRTVALGLRAGELERVIAFVASQPAEDPVDSVDGDAVHGQRLYTACAACHGTRGEGNHTLQAPPLARGSDWYLVIQLNNYRNALRGGAAEDTSGAMMRSAAAALPDEQAVRDVVAYINTLQ